MTLEPNHAPIEPSHETALSDDAVIGRAFRWSLAVIAGMAAVAAIIIAIVTRPVPQPEPVVTPLAEAQVRQRPTLAPPKSAFTEIGASAGIDFVHENGAYGDKLLPETMGGGCAFLDYDNDNDQDLLLVNSCFWPWKRPKDRPEPTMRLYRNDGSGRFDDVTKVCGLDQTFYGMGVACGDYDNDGWVDVFISAVGTNHLFKNENGNFVDVTAAAGVAGGQADWSTSCGFLDYDHDGDLDLFVCNYVQWSKEIDLGQNCTLDGKIRAYCPPTAFEGAFPILYRNDGRGKFSDVSAAAGIQIRNPSPPHGPMAKSLGLAPIDIDHDGWIDLVVANDTVQNFLFRNQRNGRFEEIGVAAGIAFSAEGLARGAMGIDSAHFRNNETIGIGIGNFANEMSALYVADRGELIFSDDAVSTGLGPPTRLFLTFGFFFFDYDLDGRLDVFSANGHLEEDIHKVQASQSYAQPAQLFWNCGPDQRTELMTVTAEQCGPDLFQPAVGRGAAFADIDGDGDLDLVMTETRGRPRLFRNDQKLGRHWVRFKLVGKRANRDAIGSWIEVVAGGTVLRQQVMPTRSYLSQVELPVTFGLGTNTRVETVRIRWPDGSEQTLTDVPIDRLIRVEQPAPAHDRL
jgi:hypothetical protein